MSYLILCFGFLGVVSASVVSRADEIDHIALLELKAKVSHLNGIGDVSGITIASSYPKLMLAEDAAQGVPSSPGSISSPGDLCFAAGQLEMVINNAKVGQFDLSRDLAAVHTTLDRLETLVGKYQALCASR